MSERYSAENKSIVLKWDKVETFKWSFWLINWLLFLQFMPQSVNSAFMQVVRQPNQKTEWVFFEKNSHCFPQKLKNDTLGFTSEMAFIYAWVGCILSARLG